MLCETCKGTGEILQCLVCNKNVERNLTAIMIYRNARISFGPFCDDCVPVLKPVEDKFNKEVNQNE